MSCFTPEQYRMATEGLLAAFPNRVALANMLVAVAETPKVQQFPRGGKDQIKSKFREVEPKSWKGNQKGR